MRVLHMPVNTASRLSYTVRALRQIGIDAYGLVFATSQIQSFDDVQAVWIGNKSHIHQSVLGGTRFLYYLYKYIRDGKPDIIHWYYSGSAFALNADLVFLRLLGIPGLIEWQGAEIRIPEVEFRENPYYTTAFDSGYEYRHMESLKQSRRRQQRFADLHFAAIVSTGMEQYIQKDIFESYYSIQQRLILSEFEPTFPKPDNPVPLIVHSPTAKIAKGTAAVLHAIEQLRDSGYRFEFRLIENLPRKEALHLLQNADIFLDQFVLGDRGLAALEAMALGKPVVCYLKSSLVAAYPLDNPIVNATQENLAEVIATLLEDGRRRYDLGQQGRAYVEKYHDAIKIAYQLVDVYDEIIGAYRKKPN